MIESDAQVASTSPHDAADDVDGENPDAWRDDIALITPMGPRQWLGMPLALFAIGAAGIVALELIAHGRGLTLQGWTLLGAASVFVIWAFPLAWAGRRADIRYDLRISQNYVRLSVTGSSYLWVLATFVGIVSGSTFVAIVGFVLLFMMRAQREVRKFGPEPSEFRRSLARIVERALLIEGIVMTATSLTCGLLAFFLPNDGSALASWYIGAGGVLFIVGAVTTAMSLRRLARDATTGPADTSVR
jgi:hypothetical protein